MKTNTDKKILKFIKERGQVAPKDIIEFIGFTASAVFRQLKKLQNQKKIQKSGTPPHVTYHIPMTQKEKIIQNAYLWTTKTFIDNNDIAKTANLYCLARDIFESRNQKTAKTLIANNYSEALSYLLYAIIGEIGNNSFDHNLGNWPNIPGVYFTIDLKEKIVILADRGRGVRSSLQEVRPDIIDDSTALRVAFTEVISGRSPEQRGNGLKFVKKIVMENKLTLTFYSGTAVCNIKNKKMSFENSNINIQGTLAVIEF